MPNKFEGLFQANHKTTGPKDGETIPTELKQEALKEVVVSNIIEPLAFQLGAIKMAKIILKSEQQGYSKDWMFWLGEEDVAELEETMFNLKNKVHAQHGIKPESGRVRRQEKMYQLYKRYGHSGSELLRGFMHRMEHALDRKDILDILEWIEQKRIAMSVQNDEYRNALKAGDEAKANTMLKKIYSDLCDDFIKSDLYAEKFHKIKSFYRHTQTDEDFYHYNFNLALRSLFLKTLYEY